MDKQLERSIINLRRTSTGNKHYSIKDFYRDAEALSIEDELSDGILDFRSYADELKTKGKTTKIK